MKRDWTELILGFNFRNICFKKLTTEFAPKNQRHFETRHYPKIRIIASVKKIAYQTQYNIFKN